MALNDIQQQQLLKLLPQYQGMRYAPDWQLNRQLGQWGTALGVDPTEARQFLNDKLLGQDVGAAKDYMSQAFFGQPQTATGTKVGVALNAPQVPSGVAGGMLAPTQLAPQLVPEQVSGARVGGPLGGPADNSNAGSNWDPSQVMEPWAFMLPEGMMVGAGPMQPVPSDPTQPALSSQGLFGGGVAPTTFTLPGQNINYFQNLPQVGLARAELPPPPDYTEVEQALAAAAPQIGSESRTTGNDIWLNMLPGFLAGLANPGRNLGETLAGAAAGAAGGAMKHSQQMKAEGREDEQAQQRYAQWVAANKMHMTSSRYNALMQRAQMEQSANNTEAGLNAQNQAMRYEAGLKQAAQFQPQVSGDNLITRNPDTGEITVRNINPQSGLYANMLNAGALPANAYSMKTVLANLPPEAVAGLQPFIAKIQKSPDFLALAGGQGGAAQADVALLSQLIAQLKQAGQTEALQSIYGAMAKGALMGKLGVK